MALMVGQYGLTPEQALTLGVAHEMDHPNPVHHYGHPNSDVDLRNNVGGVVIGLTTKPGIEMVDAEPPNGKTPPRQYPRVVPMREALRDRVIQEVTPGLCVYCLDITGF
jgi:hypothetical protein